MLQIPVTQALLNSPPSLLCLPPKKDRLSIFNVQNNSHTRSDDNLFTHTFVSPFSFARGGHASTHCPCLSWGYSTLWNHQTVTKRRARVVKFPIKGSGKAQLCWISLEGSFLCFGVTHFSTAVVFQGRSRIENVFCHLSFSSGHPLTQELSPSQLLHTPAVFPAGQGQVWFRVRYYLSIDCFAASKAGL